MKRKNLIWLIILILIIAAVLILEISKFMKYKLQKIENKLLDIAQNVISTNENIEPQTTDVIVKEELELNENVIGILEIPKLKLTAPVKEGTTQEILKYSIGHFSNSSNWDGNIALASHNRGNYVAHYFENIHELVVGDEIIYKTKFGERRYVVEVSKQIKSTDWSVISNTKENRITLITCINNNPKLRFCVQAIIKKEDVNVAG